MNTKVKEFQTFEEFYPFYLGEHSLKINRIMHFIGTCFVILIFLYSTLNGNYKLIWLCPLFGYSFAWIGHFIFEKNRPATFKYPLYGLRGDFVMWWQLLTKKIF